MNVREREREVGQPGSGCSRPGEAGDLGGSRGPRSGEPPGSPHRGPACGSPVARAGGHLPFGRAVDCRSGSCGSARVDASACSRSPPAVGGHGGPQGVPRAAIAAHVPRLGHAIGAAFAWSPDGEQVAAAAPVEGGALAVGPGPPARPARRRRRGRRMGGQALSEGHAACGEGDASGTRAATPGGVRGIAGDWGAAAAAAPTPVSDRVPGWGASARVAPPPREEVGPADAAGGSVMAELVASGSTVVETLREGSLESGCSARSSRASGVGAAPADGGQLSGTEAERASHLDRADFGTLRLEVVSSASSVVDVGATPTQVEVPSSCSAGELCGLGGGVAPARSLSSGGVCALRGSQPIVGAGVGSFSAEDAAADGAAVSHVGSPAS